VEETYEKCNCININRRDNKLENLLNEDEKYIINFIQDNINRKTIDYKIYMKKLADRKEEAAAYLIEVAKKLLKFNEEEFIEEVEHVNEFYCLLEEILEEEIEKEFETIISRFLQNTIFND
jgi:GTP-dependent phosphoenolpyruvate carboxykinase